MAEIKGMRLFEPDPSAPDVAAEGGWKCETCGMGLTNVKSTWAQVSARFKCFCGTDVEITPTEHIDGSSPAIGADPSEKSRGDSDA